MCVNNPVPFSSNEPIIAYKVMKIPLSAPNNYVCSLIAGNYYKIGEEYDAGEPLWYNNVRTSKEYGQGFHAYENLKDAKAKKSSWSRIVVKVELSDLTFKGEEIISSWHKEATSVLVYVANKCKFLEILPTES